MMLDAKILRVIEEEWLEKVVEKARDTMERGRVFGRHCKEHGWFSSGARCPLCRKKFVQILPRAQLSNLKDLADATDSVLALEFFIRYQMGRREGEGWKYEDEGGERFGDMVISDFETLGEWAKEISLSNPKPVHLWLIRLYTGFLVRWYVALAGEEISAAEETT